MEWLIGLGAAAVLLIAADRLVAHGVFDRFLDRPRVERTGGGALSGVFDVLGELYQPARDSLVAERERQRMDIRQAGDDAPPFDLDEDAFVVHPDDENAAESGTESQADHSDRP